MIEPLDSTIIEQIRNALVGWKQVPPAPGDGPLTWKEEAIFEMRKQLSVWLQSAQTGEERQQIWKEFEEWKAQVEALKERPKDD